jgi:hypothetical protein
VKAKLAQRQQGSAARPRAGPAPAASVNVGRAVQLARSAPRALDTASILSLQAHSGNAALAELLGGDHGRARTPPASRAAAAGARAGSAGDTGHGGGTVVDLRDHPRFGDVQRAPGARPGVVVQLQGGAVACPEPPVTAPPVEPHDDPGFQNVKARVGGIAAEKRKHPSPKAKADEAQAAAAPPTSEGPSQAAAAQVDDMHEQKPGTFDKKAFVAAVRKAIDAATPKTMEEVDDFKSSGKAGAMGTQVSGQVSSSKDAAARDIRDTSKAPPDSRKAEVKPPTPMEQESPGPAPGDVGAARAMPPPKPADQVHLDHTACETNSKLAEANVTDDMVAQSNEPEFHTAMDAKKQADEHAATAPQEVRQTEQSTLAQSKSEAAGQGNQGVAGLHGAKVGALGAMSGHQQQTKTKNEAARADVSTHINGIYTKTKTDVDGILAELDTKVDDAFKQGEKAAHDAFVTHVDEKKTAYFAKRYGDWDGDILWAKDKLTSPPSEVNGFIDQGRALYLERMDEVINNVAELVVTQLTAAKTRIADGRKEIKTYVDGLKGDLKEVGQQAEADIGAKFDQLDQDVESKQGAMVDSLAQKYVEARTAVDAEVDKMKEANKGLLDRAMDAVAGMVGIVLKMKDMLTNVLSRAAGVIGDIIAHPIAFFENLGGAVKQGLGQFVSNIETHLQEGLTGWLFGELGAAGITMPEHLDFKGLLHLAGQVLGFTWDHIKEIAKKVLGEKVVALLEKGAAAFGKVMEIFDLIRKEGLAGIWHLIQEKLADLEESILGQIKNFVITKVITAGVTWIVSLLNPASAFVKACKAIYDFVMFLVERGQQIVEFVNAILDNLAAIVSGAIGTAAGLVETVLAKALPLAISMLASLLGLGGIGEKIKEVIHAVRAPVENALHWLMATVIKPLAKVAMKGISWVTGKVKAGAAWVKGKAKAGVAKLKAKFGKKKRDEAGSASRSADLRSRAADLVMGRLHGDHTEEQVHAVVSGVRTELQPLGLHRLDLRPAEEPGDYYLVAQASDPTKVAKLKQRKPPVRTAAVTLQARLVFDRPAVAAIEQGRGSPLKFQEKDLPRVGQPETRYAGEVYGRRSAAAGRAQDVPSGRYEAQHKIGSHLVRPDDVSTAQEVTIKSWNTGEPRPESNASHAERSFAPWVEHAVAGGGLREVHVQINYSPCSICCNYLPDVKRVSGLIARLTYVTAYEARDKNNPSILLDGTTTIQSLEKLHILGWDVSGPTPRYKDDNDVRAEREATFSIMRMNP